MTGGQRIVNYLKWRHGGIIWGGIRVFASTDWEKVRKASARRLGIPTKASARRLGIPTKASARRLGIPTKATARRLGIPTKASARRLGIPTKASARRLGIPTKILTIDLLWMLLSKQSFVEWFLENNTNFPNSYVKGRRFVSGWLWTTRDVSKVLACLTPESTAGHAMGIDAPVECASWKWL
jgi:hypothetical protein